MGGYCGNAYNNKDGFCPARHKLTKCIDAKCPTDENKEQEESPKEQVSQ